MLERQVTPGPLGAAREPALPGSHHLRGELGRGASEAVPVLDFPAGFLKAAGSFGYGGTTINGETFPPNPLAPTPTVERR